MHRLAEFKTLPGPSLSQARQWADMADRGNVVAKVAYDLSRSPYPMGSDGYQRAVREAGESLYRLTDKSNAAAPGILLPEANQRWMNIGKDRSPYSQLLDQAGRVAQIWPSEGRGIPNAPGPLATMLTLGALGAVGGRVGAKGWNRLTGQSNPSLVNQATVIGGLAGTVPGLFSSAVNYYAGESPLFGKVMATGRKQGSESVFTKHGFTAIPVEGVHEMVFNDPSVSRRLPPSIAAATSALVEGANRTSPFSRDMPFVTPMDIGRMAVGMGSGYASGVVVGRVLGGIFGVSDSSQKILRNSGAVAGLIRAVVPSAFGG